MKILKIENEQGYFVTTNDGGWQSIDKIDKNGLLVLLDLFLADEVEIDSPDDHTISNQAHQIIYRGIFEKLSQLSSEKSRFKDESERLYLEEMKRYSPQ
ncbi:MAG: hypothetical protein OIF58_15710 [Cohaesibacter sp.]|nr:hypothetical protein [Cohaesibacter sp.]